MTRILARIFETEIICAVRIAALCDYWAASAAARLGKISANVPE